MKFNKITVIILVFALSIVFTGCGKEDGGNVEPEQEEVDKQPVE
ncbi:hypothetical protein [Peijinzhouia sedimentorum]|tara:strand:- start:652 stop:783 length:132 start_codon:yes stop_codon:yes gene_type:complete